MKKKLVVVLAATMLATTLFGCGKDTSETTTNETTDVSDTESVEDTNASTSSDSGTLGDALGIEDTESTETTSTNVTWAGNKYINGYSWKFPDNEYGTTGLTCKYVIDENTSDCITHVESPKGTMDFVWSGPVDLGTRAGGTNNGVSLWDTNGDYILDAWYGGEIDDEKFDKDLAFDQATWVSFNKTFPYVDNGYYDIVTSDSSIEVTFEVANDTHKGYAYYVVNKNLSVCYQYCYVEKISIYDDTRAKNVIDSIDFAINAIPNYENIELYSTTQ